MSKEVSGKGKGVSGKGKGKGTTDDMGTKAPSSKAPKSPKTPSMGKGKGMDGKGNDKSMKKKQMGMKGKAPHKPPLSPTPQPTLGPGETYPPTPSKLQYSMPP
jgi:hypothetical protein